MQTNQNKCIIVARGANLEDGLKQVTLTAITEREGDGYVSLCPELDIASQGDSKDEARQNLLEAIEGFLEVASPQEIEGRLGTERYIETVEVSIG